MKQNTLTKFVEASWFTKTIMTLIVINALILGMETYPAITATYGPILKAVDYAILWVFVAEIVLKIAAYRVRFLRDPWNIFDAFVIAIAFVPAQEAFSVLRAIRVLRVLRLISIFPRLRRVLSGLVVAIPGIGSIGAILAHNTFSDLLTRNPGWGVAHPVMCALHEAFGADWVVTSGEYGAHDGAGMADAWPFARPQRAMPIMLWAISTQPWRPTRNMWPRGVNGASASAISARCPSPRPTCGPAASETGAPISSLTASARSPARFWYSPMIACSSSRRSSREDCDHVPNAARAALTARSTSAAVPSAILPDTTSVVGLSTSRDAGSIGSTHWPSM